MKYLMPPSVKSIVEIIAKKYEFDAEEALAYYKEQSKDISNEKRRTSCKKNGGEKKREGHDRERVFIERWGDTTDKLTMKAESDAHISYTTQDGCSLSKELEDNFGYTRYSNFVSIKGGNNIQFTLGRIPELLNTDNPLNVVKTMVFWKKYLGKSLSGNPAGWFVYRNDNEKTWIFFRMNDVVEFIADKGLWRRLSTGRIKGDFDDSSKNRKRQYLTYEYRETHKGYFLGANGNRGKLFITLLQAKLKYLIVVDK
jgi:hypothetical protein